MVMSGLPFFLMPALSRTLSDILPEQNTNVVKFYSLLKKDDDFDQQLCYYQVGTGHRPQCRRLPGTHIHREQSLIMRVHVPSPV